MELVPSLLAAHKVLHRWEGRLPVLEAHRLHVTHQQRPQLRAAPRLHDQLLQCWEVDERGALDRREGLGSEVQTRQILQI